MTADAHHHHHHHGGHGHAHATPASPTASVLRLSALQRVLLVAVPIAALWSLVYWAMR